MTGNVLLSDFVEQEESSIMESQKKETSEWTNMKHSLYLKSIEASFIDQLYNSYDMYSCRTQKMKKHTNSSIPSGQFKVLQGGCWSNKKFRRDEKHSDVNSWIQHFTNPQKRPLSQQNYVPDSHHLFQESGCSNTEVTDQNFVEDKANRPNNRKRKIVANSSNDQVVPFCTFPENKLKDVVDDHLYER